ncbi:DUF2059 domain-containing protein [Luteolibacter sp. AS25]|uniref:DUF2059 domain-containing protein n=1 Tax=Luteolibacter sp. AS25 TaxID=3135776 RepID=UPI00398AA47E
MKTALLALAFIAGTSILPISAQEEQAPAIRLLEMMNFKETALTAANAMFAPVLQNMKAQGLPQEAIDEISIAANAFFAKTYDNPELATEMAQVYSDNFSDAEIEELIMFYQTQLGQKTLLTMPQVMQQAAQLGQKYAMQNQAEFQQEIQDIMAKYSEEKAPAEEPAPNE